MTHTSEHKSPLGRILLAEKDGKLIGVWLEGQKHGLKLLDGTERAKETPAIVRAKSWLDRYFAGEEPQICELSIELIGSPFRLMVWELLREIPYGQVTTYGALAKKAAAVMGKPKMSAQAIGGAVGHNPISIIIPCHRVVGTNGTLTGYDGGTEMKAWLLAHEGVDMTKGFLDFSKILV